MVDMHRNNWSPDTCGCKVGYEWDRDIPSDQRVFTLVEVMTTCPSHSNLMGNALYDTILPENQRKNKLLGFLNITFDELVNIITRNDGQVVRNFKIPISWAFTGFDGNRVLEINLSNLSLTDVKKTQIQTFADSAFGAGKVVII